MKFTLGTDTLEIKTPVSYSMPVNDEIIQVKARSASGVSHVESYGNKIRVIKYNYDEISTAEAESLLNWFLNVSNGMEFPFTIEDDLGNTFEGSFVESTLPLELTAYDIWTVSFNIEVQ